MRKQEIVKSGLGVAILVMIAVWWLVGRVRQPLQQEKPVVDAAQNAVVQNHVKQEGRNAALPQLEELSDEDDVEETESMTEEEKREIEEEKRVEAFDNLTDKWMEPVTKGISMSDVEHFAKLFRQVPKGRRDECIHRALNLIPDENVMLLAGVLMDKEMDAEIVEDVYNDVLNRDEEIKKPILQQIFKDKSHPCWADTAWILDVTDELPEKK